MKTKTKIEVALSIFFTFAIVFIYAMIFKPILNDTGRMIAKPLVYICHVGAPLILCRAMKNPICKLGFKKDSLLKQVLTGIGVFAVLAFIFTIAVFMLGNNKGILLTAKETRIGIFIYSIVFDIVFVGMGEEMLFRGYFMDRFHTLTGSGVWAVVIPALMFGIWHFPNNQDFLQLILLPLVGAAFGFARLKIKDCSTLSVGIAHGLYDSYILVLSLILL
jgi:membrane protease YdiL (CAAX protease family)